MDNKYHCWYSHKHAAVAGSVIYRREDGTDVEVTAIGSVDNQNSEFYKWPDKEYRGIVTTYVGPGQRGVLREDLWLKEKSVSMKTNTDPRLEVLLELAYIINKLNKQ